MSEPTPPTARLVVESGEGGWVRLCPADSVEADRPVGLFLVPVAGEPAPDPRELPDRDKVCVARDGDRLVAMLDRCPHRDIRLSGGVVDGGLLTCPGHFWRFALTDGRRTDKPDEIATLYPTKVEDGWVWALLPARPAKLSMREWLLQQARENPR